MPKEGYDADLTELGHVLAEAIKMTAIAAKQWPGGTNKGKERIELYNDVFTLIWGETFSWTLGLLKTLRRGVVGRCSNKRLCWGQ